MCELLDPLEWDVNDFCTSEIRAIKWRDPEGAGTTIL
jgi:hypothetical protein